jgi:hypothetical protein
MPIEGKIKVIKMPENETTEQQIPDHPMRDIKISLSILLVVYRFHNIEVVQLPHFQQYNGEKT